MNYAPELVGVGKYSGEMASWLANNGHEVRVVAAPPFYPEWKIANGFSGSSYSREKRDGLEVFRCPIWVPAKPSGIKRSLHLLSFALSSLPVLLQQFAWRPDIVWVVEPTFLAFPGALLLAQISGARSWAHVQDLEIDAAFDLGILPSGPSTLFFALERFLMRRFDRVSTISENMLARIRQKGVTDTHSVLFPNWIDTEAIYPLPDASPMRAELGIDDHSIVALYSGSMAAKQGFEVLIDAIKQLCHNPKLHFVLCGDGPSRQNLVEAVSSFPNVHLLPLQPLDRLNELLNVADVHLLPQHADAADLVMPAKLLGMFASGRPVVATTPEKSQLAKAVQGRGFVVPPSDARAFAEAIQRLIDNPVLMRDLGREARRYAVTNMNAGAILPKFASDLVSLSSSRRMPARSAAQVGD